MADLKSYWMGRAVQAGRDGTRLTMTPVEWVRFIEAMKQAGEPAPLESDCYREPPVTICGVELHVVCPNCGVR
jgi:hypothetical protein